MEWIGNLVSFGALGQYKRESAAYQIEAMESHRDNERLCTSLEDTEGKLKAAESQLSVVDSRVNHFKAENESLQAEVIRLREELQDTQTKRQILEEGSEVIAVRAAERVERLEGVNATALKGQREAWVELSRERSTSARLRWFLKTQVQQEINQQRNIDKLLVERGELCRRVEELAPFRARYERWKTTFQDRKRDEGGRFLPRTEAETPTKEAA